MEKQIIEYLVFKYVACYSELKKTQTTWRNPLTAFADAHDPLFSELRRVVSPTHAMPDDILPDARTVITYFVPLSRSIAKSNIEGRHSSEQWALAYVETNQLLQDLSRHLQESLCKHGFDVATLPVTHNFNPKSLISDWSHRHIAYMAGLGTFGINNMLITDKGCCGRLGSIVTNVAIPETGRGKTEHCLYKYNGSCGTCAERCVNEALFLDSFDRHRCYSMCRENDNYHSALDLTEVCGKCLVGVPCTFSNPIKKRDSIRNSSVL